MCVTAVMTAITVAGSVAAGVGAVGQAVYTQQATQASMRAERARQAQMRAEAFRQRRETMRRSMAANAMARARNISQTGSLQNTALFGAYGQNQGEAGRTIAATNENENIGNQIFAANADMARAQGMAATFNGLGQLGNSMMTNAKQLSQTSVDLFGQGGYFNPRPYTTGYNNPFTAGATPRGFASQSWGGPGASPY